MFKRREIDLKLLEGFEKAVRLQGQLFQLTSQKPVDPNRLKACDSYVKIWKDALLAGFMTQDQIEQSRALLDLTREEENHHS